MRPRIAPSALLILVGLSATTSAQERTARLAPMFGDALLRVAKVELSGTITLKSDAVRGLTRNSVPVVGLLVPKGEPSAIAKVFIADVEKKSALARTSPEAAELFAEGNLVVLIGVEGDADALKGIPDRIALADTDEQRAAIRGAREAAIRSRSVDNLKQIGLALHNYVSANGHLPPAVLRGPDGKPRHSWRVLLLPYLEQLDLYKQYDFSQPWDSERNRKVLDRMPGVYRDPSCDEDNGPFTGYAVLSGEDTPFPPEGVRLKRDFRLFEDEGRVSFHAITDGLSNTIAVAPVYPKQKIPWTKPEDIAVGDDFPGFGEPRGIAAPYTIDSEKVAPILLMDGAVKLLSARTEPPAMHAMATKAGGEGLANEALARRIPPETGMPTTLTIRVEGGKATATLR